MKKALLIIYCMIMSLNVVFAQDDSKYLRGAVPMTNGKVVFSSTINAPTLTKAELYNIILNWANNYFKPDPNDNGKLAPRVILQNADEGQIVGYGEQYIVFTSSFMSLDRTRVMYHLIINCVDGKVNMDMMRIHYLYDENRNGGLKYDAETWIDDKTAVNKKNTKLQPICGKFRKKTIDLKDEIFKSAQNAVGEYLISRDQKNAQAQQKQVETQQPAQQVTMTQNVTDQQNNESVVTPPKHNPIREVKQSNIKEAVNTLKDETTITRDNTATIEKEIKDASRITVASEGDELTLSEESWGGFGEMFGKKVLFILVDTQKTMANMMFTNNDSYEIRFYKNGQNQPVQTIKCKKLTQQSTKGSEAMKINSKAKPESTYNMYVGEVE
ncbi:MAG: DUF4468 domain-containing protein [Phocaeicola sp.]|uniref:DUF4468 domain-containing protein n=1 Tax=Phocaeicola sp. TaxID=2773926 RepID=UPI003F9F9CCB